MIRVFEYGVRHIPRARILGAYLYSRSVHTPATLYRKPDGGWHIQFYNLRPASRLKAKHLLPQSLPPQLVTVPNVLGEQLSAAITSIASAGLALGQVTFQISSGTPGVVLSQNPANPAMVLSGTSIALVVSQSQAPVQPIPNVVGLTPQAAVAAINAAGYTLVNQELNYDVLTPPGFVSGQFPAAGLTEPASTIITIYVSIGPFVPAPSVNLGYNVTTRNFSLLEMVSREWGSSFSAPDHRVYQWSNGRGFDSTDMGTTGIYQNGTRT